MDTAKVLLSGLNSQIKHALPYHKQNKPVSIYQPGIIERHNNALIMKTRFKGKVNVSEGPASYWI